MADENPGAILFKRSKSSRSTRQRSPPPAGAIAAGGDATGETAAADGDAGETASPSLSFKDRKKREKEKRAKGAKGAGARLGGLSFGGEEEAAEETFKPKKSNLSLGLKARLNSAALAAAPSPPSTPSYSKHVLDELKAATPSTPPVRDAAGDVSMVDADTGGISDIARRIYGDDAVQQDSSIPSEAAIIAAKQRREKVRANPAMSTSEDFISLSEGGGVVARRSDLGGRAGPHPESRLQREDDELGEGDEEMAEFTGANERVPLGKRAAKDAARREKRERGELIGEAEEDEDDEEQRQWEAAQVQRAAWGPEAMRRAQPEKAVYRAAPIPDPTPLPALPAAINQLASLLSTLQASHAEHTASLGGVQADLRALDDQEAALRRQVDEVETRRAWFDEMRNWAENVGGFLEVKFPLLEDLEAQHLSILTERSEMLSKRRALDDQDDFALLSLSALPSSFGASRAPDGEVADVEMEEVDELGRTIRREDNEAVRRARRAERAERLTAQGKAGDGFETDDELTPSDARDYETAQAKLRDGRGELFEDVKAPEFQDAEVGLVQRFRAWRERWPEEYEKAWGGLGLVGAWEFWGRCEVLGWEPLRDPRPLPDFQFYTALHAYSQRSEEEAEQDRPEQQEMDLIPPYLATVLIPRFVKLFGAGGYDPVSARQTREAVELVEMVEGGLAGESGQKLEALLASLVQPLLAALTASITPLRAAPPPMGAPAPGTPRARIFNRRLKLLRNAMLWRRVAGRTDDWREGVRDAAGVLARWGGEEGREMVRGVVGDLLLG